ncbi:DEKNAAC104639 [Brettanomyces naardenensis]|uniref:Vacuolar fusion protein MON1 n=1 Tax=Brettanomyces naardenensis TaxID=13370 RepID=A0A448YRB6_BRENA|nr:DEKNAAC104639 [Brettanomyces naardenensis]
MSIVFHEDYIPGSNYDDHSPAHSVKRKPSRVTVISRNLVPEDLLAKASPTSSVNRESVLETESSLGEPDVVLCESPATNVRRGEPSSSFSESRSGSNSIQPDDALSRILSPIVNDTRPSYNMAAPSIFSEQLSIPEQESFHPLVNMGLQLESADRSADERLFFSRKKHFFILSSAGKPIYSMHGSDDIIAVYSGVIQTIISLFQYGSDGGTEKLRSVVAEGPNGQHIKFLFLNLSPILLMTCSTLGESDVQLGQQLDFLYNFLLAALSKPHIDKVFQRRENFDLRNILGKTDIACFDAICNDLANFNNPGLIIEGLECLKLRSSIRDKISGILLQHKTENLLYGLLVAPGGRLVDVLRPKGQALKTTDLQLLFSMIYKTNTFKSARRPDQNDDRLSLTQNEDFWVPICLPKFNPNGFLYAFIQFVDLKDERLMKLHDLNTGILDDPDDKVGEFGPYQGTELTVILISAFKDRFYEMRNACNRIVRDLQLCRSVYRELYKGIVGTQGSDGSTGFPSGRVSPTDIPAPLVKHFVFKSKRDGQYGQYVYSRLQGNREELRLEENPQMRGQLMMIYSYLHSKHTSSIGMSSGVIREPSDADNDSPVSRRSYLDMVKWKVGSDYLTGVLISTPACDLYLINNGGVVDRQMLLDSCKKIIIWCRENERSLFIRSGAVF